MSYEQLIAYIDGLYADMVLSEQDYVDIINYIISNGEPLTDPRDLIQIRRGNEADLPVLAQGELALTLDTEKFFGGGVGGNFEIGKKQDRQYIFISDSYGESPSITESWLKYVKDYISETSYSNFISGGGFGSPIKLLTALQGLDGTIVNKNAITNIVVGCGYNDTVTGATVPSTEIQQGITDFADYVKLTYPNAKVEIACIALTTDDSKRGVLFNNTVANYKIGSTTNDIVSFIENSHKVFHDYASLNVDGIHPIDNGSQIIARGLAGYVKTGVVNYDYSLEKNVQVTASGVNTGSDITFLQRDIGEKIRLNVFGFTALVVSGVYNTYTEIGTIPPSLIRGLAGSYTLIDIMGSTFISAVQAYVPCTFKISGGKIYFLARTAEPFANITFGDFAMEIDKIMC